MRSMITRYQAGITVVVALGVIWGSRSAVSRSFTDNVREPVSQQSAATDRFGERLNSDGTMFGVTLGRTRVYDTKGLQEPKSVLWKTPKLFTINPREDAPSVPAFPIYHGAGTIITADNEAYFIRRIDDGHLLFVIDLQTGEVKSRFKL